MPCGCESRCRGVLYRCGVAQEIKQGTSRKGISDFALFIRRNPGRQKLVIIHLPRSRVRVPPPLLFLLFCRFGSQCVGYLVQQVRLLKPLRKRHGLFPPRPLSEPPVCGECSSVVERLASWKTVKLPERFPFPFFIRPGGSLVNGYRFVIGMSGVRSAPFSLGSFVSGS